MNLKRGRIHSSTRHMMDFSSPQVTLDLKLLRQNKESGIYEAHVNLGTNLENSEELLVGVKPERDVRVYSAKARDASSKAYDHLRL